VKPAPFEYFAPTDIEEVLVLLAQYGDEAKILAGGQSLIPLMNMRLARPRVIIDINGLSELTYTSPGSHGGLAIGALTRQRAVERSSLVQTHNPLLAAAMQYIGHVQIRNRGTIGGSLVHADPAAELPALSLALEAKFVLRSMTGQRVLSAADFFLTYLTTAIEPIELLTEVRLPPWMGHWRWGFQEVCRRDGDFALVGAVAVLQMDAQTVCQRLHLILFGVGGTPVRLQGAEEMLSGRQVDDRMLNDVAKVVAEVLEPDSDIHASAEYRKEVGGVVARRALEAALGKVKGRSER
jgi:aerobic carbon-monoxide dehydrogenase medium subunit